MQYVAQGISDVPFHGADMEKKFEIVKYLDPRFDCNNAAYIDNRYVVVSGGPQISRYESECDEYSADILRWGNRRTLGSKFLYDSHWYIKYTVNVRISWTSHVNINNDIAEANGAGSDNAKAIYNMYKDLFADNISFKPFPLTQCTRSIVLKLNDKEISCLPRETLAARMEYWDPKALYKGCNTCPCERLNTQSFYQSGQNMLTNPFRSMKNCLMAEKSNATLPDSQVTYHIASNGCDFQGRAVEDGQHNLIYTCVLCNNNINAINLPVNGKNGTRLSPNEVYYNCQTTFYEPVLIEPLTFTNGSEFNPPMWNLDNFELTYNLDNLDNMIIINKHAIIKKLAMRVRNPGNANENVGTGADHVGGTTTYDRAGSYYDNDNDLFLAESDTEVKWSDILSGLQVSFIGKPQLIYYVYTPIPGNEPRLPYMAPYKEFKRYRYSSTSSTVKRRELVKGYNDNNVPTMYFDTGRIDMVYYPHSIYLYVGEANANRMSSLENRITHPESFARITKVNCIYGNCTTILDSFKDLDFYNMSLRNGLKGRAYYDWLIVNSSMGLPESYSYVKDPSENNAVAGIGSVVRLTPGIDLHTGGMTGRMIGGCPAVSKSITFQVQAKPLDIFTQGSKEYELYVIFEQQGALVMQDGQCRVGLVGCESVEWYDMQPLAQVTCDYNMYGSEVGGGSFFTKARKAMKKGVGIVKKGAEHNLFSSALGAAANITGNSHVGNAAQYARRFEGLAAKRPALADPNAEPSSGAGFRKRRFYH